MAIMFAGGRPAKEQVLLDKLLRIAMNIAALQGVKQFIPFVEVNQMHGDRIWMSVGIKSGEKKFVDYSQSFYSDSPKEAKEFVANTNKKFDAMKKQSVGLKIIRRG
jgi:hypothetical protein